MMLPAVLFLLLTLTAAGLIQLIRKKVMWKYRGLVFILVSFAYFYLAVTLFAKFGYVFQ